MSEPSTASASVDPDIKFLFELARNPTRLTLNDNEISVRTRIMSLKVGSEGRIESRESKQRSRKRVDRPLPTAVTAKQSERAERRRPKKRKTMKRCTSPSHFAVEPEEEIRYGEDYTLDLPSRERVDNLLRGVSSFYYRPKEAHPNQTAVWVESEYDQTQYTTLDLLLSPIRRVTARESWNNKEIAIFEAAMCKYPKQFSTIAKLVKTKTTQEIVKFYYTSDETNAHHAHYRIWKGDTSSASIQSSNTTGVSKLRQSPNPSARKSTNPLGSPQSQSSASATIGSITPGVGSTNPDSAAHSGIPSSLITSRQDSQHARIRIVDPKTGKESYFILPALDPSVDIDQTANDPSIEDESDVDEESAADPSTLSSTDKPLSSASASGSSSSPQKGYKCCLPSPYDPAVLCHKFCRTTNALGSHLRQAHRISKASSSAESKNYYVECIQ